MTNKRNSLFEESGAEALAHMNQRTNKHVISLLSVKDVVRLETKSAVAGTEVVGIGSDTGKVRKQSKCPLAPGMWASA